MTISEVNSSWGSATQNQHSHTNSQVSLNQRENIHKKLDLFYCENLSNHGEDEVNLPHTYRPEIEIEVDESNTPQRENMKSFRMASEMLIRKSSNASNANTGYDNSIRTSPFNRDTITYDHMTMSSALKSGKNTNSDFKQPDNDYTNEDDLYNLSNENSKENGMHEVVEIRTHEDAEADSSIEVQSDLSQDQSHTQSPSPVPQHPNLKSHPETAKSIEIAPTHPEIVVNTLPQNPTHKKQSSSIFSSNTQDLHKLLYSHKRDNSNGIYSTQKYTETIMSNHESNSNGQSSMRASKNDNLLGSVYLQNHWNMYAQNEANSPTSMVQSDQFQNENKYYIDQPDGGNYPDVDQNQPSLEQIDRNYMRNSKEENLAGDISDDAGMNFDEYYRTCTQSDGVINVDHKLAISEEQRNNLMQRIMILKMQQNSQNSQDSI